jgi:hypothetical protein
MGAYVYKEDQAHLSQEHLTCFYELFFCRGAFPLFGMFCCFSLCWTIMQGYIQVHIFCKVNREAFPFLFYFTKELHLTTLL